MLEYIVELFFDGDVSTDPSRRDLVGDLQSFFESREIRCDKNHVMLHRAYHV